MWSSIDNDSSRDLDQIEVAERVADGIRLLIGIADVDSDVRAGSPIDIHAAKLTTTVYTGVRTFAMLPEELSTNLTSLNEAADRMAIVVEMLVAPDGKVFNTSIYPALVRNQAQLKLQDEAAESLLNERHRLGALNMDRVETEAVITNGKVEGIHSRQKNRATELIENFMVAADAVHYADAQPFSEGLTGRWSGWLASDQQIPEGAEDREVCDGAA